ncbi:hypothetical protein CLOP_g23749 [Closterium sp. NIES-67]|nr:hypothetical protein CLOP_g23749 [Closterium sp. NIES-67]
MGTTREGLGEDVCKEERAIEEERVERQEMRPLPREKPYPFLGAFDVAENALGRLPVLGKLVADLEGCGDGFGRGHLEAFKDLLEVECLREGDGPGRTIARNLHPEVVADLPQVLAEEALLQLILDLL